MNKSRREALAKIEASMDDLRSQVEAVRDEEQDTYDNLPDSFQGSDRGQAMETAISTMDDVISDLENAVTNIQTAQE